MSVAPFEKWGEINFASISDQQYCLVIQSILNRFEEYSPDPRFKEAPPAENTPKTCNDYT